VGQGQRVLTSEAGDHAIMDIREIVFQPAVA
jgi:protein involved in temperature-dependent protein secretion